MSATLVSATWITYSVSGAAPALRRIRAGRPTRCRPGGSSPIATAISTTATPPVASMSPSVPVWGAAWYQAPGVAAPRGPATTGRTYPITAATAPLAAARTAARRARPLCRARSRHRMSTTPSSRYGTQVISGYWPVSAIPRSTVSGSPRLSRVTVPNSTGPGTLWARGRPPTASTAMSGTRRRVGTSSRGAVIIIARPNGTSTTITEEGSSSSSRPIRVTQAPRTMTEATAPRRSPRSSRRRVASTRLQPPITAKSVEDGPSVSTWATRASGPWIPPTSGISASGASR